MASSSSVRCAPHINGLGIARSAFPVYLTMVAGLIGSMVVIGSLGRYATLSLAAFALVMSVVSPASAAISGILRGAMPFIAPKRDDPEALVPVLWDVRWLSIMVGAVGACVVAGVPVLARIVGVDASVQAELGVLPLLMAVSVLIDSAGGGASSALIAMGRSRQVLWSGLAKTIVLVVLTPPAVAGFQAMPGLGLAGAGIVAILGSLLGVIIANLCLAASPGLAGRLLHYRRPRLRMMRELAKVGVPIGATLVVKFALLSVVAFAVARVDAQAAAAHGILNSLASLMFIAAIAVGMAAVPEIARATPDGTNAVRRVGFSALKVAVACAGGSAVVMWLSSTWVIPWFSDDATVIRQVGALVPVLLVVAVVDGCQAAVGAALNALRRTVPSLVLFVIGYGVLAMVSVPMANVAGLGGIWWAMAGVTIFLWMGQSAAFFRCSGRLGTA
jgi:MATE family multidrug resistance protein